MNVCSECGQPDAYLVKVTLRLYRHPPVHKNYRGGWSVAQVFLCLDCALRRFPQANPRRPIKLKEPKSQETTLREEEDNKCLVL